MGEDEETAKGIEIPTVIVKDHPRCILQSSWLISTRPFGIITNASVYLISKKDKTARVPIAPSRYTVVPKGAKTDYDIKSTKCNLVVKNSIVMITRATTLKKIVVNNGTVNYTYFVGRLGDKCVVCIDGGTVDLTGSIFHELEIHANGGKVFGFRVIGKLTVYLNAPTHISGKTTNKTLVFKHGDGDITLQDFIRRL